MKNFLFSLFLLPGLFNQWQVASQIEIGAWRDHFPYYNATSIVSTGEKIFCSSPYALFYYRLDDFSITKLSRTNGLSDVGISTINYDQQSNWLVVAYDNANIDIIQESHVYNLSDIKNKQIQGNKKIYQIVFNGKLAYMACGFGIVVLDLEKKEVKETYYIGPNASAIEVYSIVFDENYIYATTESGIYQGQKDNPGLVDFNQWQKLNNLPYPDAKYTAILAYNSGIYACMLQNSATSSVVYRLLDGNWSEFYAPGKLINKVKESNGKLIIIEEKAINIFGNNLLRENQITEYGFAGAEPNDIHISPSGQLFIADKSYSLLISEQGSSYEFIIPNGPYNNHVGDIDAQNNQVWVAGGGHTSFGGNIGNFGELFEFSNETWLSHILWTSNARDFNKVLINPYKPSEVYAGAWGAGIFVFENGELKNTYNEQNSSLQSIYPGEDYIRIGGMLMDPFQNLYVTNTGVTAPISVKTPDGNWYSYNYSELLGPGDVGEIIHTQYGNKWVQLARGGGLFVFNDNYTFSDLDDDIKKRFSIYDETGQFATNEVYSLAEDENGLIWVGTDMGVFTYFNPESVFEQDAYYASRIKVVDKNNPDFVQYLLAKEKINAIAIDGANRKWFGTQNSGAFLMSENGEEEIFHFTSENSKLISNNISSIAINPKNGEVFFGTDKGMVSYKGTATSGDDLFTGAYIYPNPVRENYDGEITITGLAANVDVKITDIAGQLVYQTRAFGGQALWNGKSFTGKRVNTGVYLVFCTDETGQKKKVLKLLFVN